jgi:hypothetical protein
MQVLPAATAMVRKLKKHARMYQEITLEEFEDNLPDVITALQRCASLFSGSALPPGPG